MFVAGPSALICVELSSMNVHPPPSIATGKGAQTPSQYIHFLRGHGGSEDILPR